MTDDELLESLSRALSPEARQPSPASVFALRRAVVEGRPARTPPARWRRRLVAFAVLVPVV
ncbi:MAG: hypothetical protein M3Z84_03330, partial [Actinomycetota bacterium]|nr:hypothetical protein [Actinomycetota bacterium]